MRIFILFIYCLSHLPAKSYGQHVDTLTELKKVVAAIKQANDVTYGYEMDVKFPDGQRDHMKGTVYINNDELLYYSESDAFTMIYTNRWFYRADHRKMKVSVVDMNKEYNKKQRKGNEKDIFQNGMVSAFLDTILLKTGRIRLFRKDKDTLRLTLEFPKSSVVRKMDIAYDGINEVPVTYNMSVCHPWQNGSKSAAVIETNIKCHDFKKNVSPDAYREDNFFSYKNSRIELRKYKAYKFFTKI